MPAQHDPIHHNWVYWRLTEDIRSQVPMIGMSMTLTQLPCSRRHRPSQPQKSVAFLCVAVKNIRLCRTTFGRCLYTYSKDIIIMTITSAPKLNGAINRRLKVESRKMPTNLYIACTPYRPYSSVRQHKVMHCRQTKAMTQAQLRSYNAHAMPEAGHAATRTFTHATNRLGHYDY
jgi:hypothetical protein